MESFVWYIYIYMRYIKIYILCCLHIIKKYWNYKKITSLWGKIHNFINWACFSTYILYRPIKRTKEVIWNSVNFKIVGSHWWLNPAILSTSNNLSLQSQSDKLFDSLFLWLMISGEWDSYWLLFTIELSERKDRDGMLVKSSYSFTEQ